MTDKRRESISEVVYVILVAESGIVTSVITQLIRVTTNVLEANNTSSLNRDFRERHCYLYIFPHFRYIIHW